MMDELALLEGDDLAAFLEVMEAMTTGRERVYQLRVCVDDGQVKVKANGRTWTPGYGHLDPTCQAAQRPAQPHVSRGHLPDGVWPDPDARPTY